VNRVALAIAGGMFLCASTVWAEDMVYFREPGKKADNTVEGIIEQESPAGVKVRTKAGVKDIPALQITQITYENKPVDKLSFRRPFTTESRAFDKSVSATKKAELLKSALSGYQDLDSKLRGEDKIHRYLQFKIAHTTALLAKDDRSLRDAAIAALTEYKTGFSDGWEIVPALQRLAQLQEEKGDAPAASRTYADLAEVPGISAKMKLTAQLRGAQLLLRVNKFADAETKLNQLAATMPQDDPQRILVDVYLVQSQIAQNRFDGVEEKLKTAIRSSEDKTLRALAHNFLGDYYRAKKELDRAFWEYLKVDTMYNQDTEEHAKALYYLSQLFDIPKNDRERAAECLAKLNLPQFDGTHYQRMASDEKKTP
jgi:predicted negative regulator of RcsB-dependent stress response